MCCMGTPLTADTRARYLHPPPTELGSQKIGTGLKFNVNMDPHLDARARFPDSTQGIQRSQDLDFTDFTD
jgi:hypothetical protein